MKRAHTVILLLVGHYKQLIINQAIAKCDRISKNLTCSYSIAYSTQGPKFQPILHVVSSFGVTALNSMKKKEINLYSGYSENTHMAIKLLWTLDSTAQKGLVKFLKWKPVSPPVHMFKPKSVQLKMLLLPNLILPNQCYDSTSATYFHAVWR